MVAAKRYDRAEFLDLDISVEQSQVATRNSESLPGTLMPTYLLPPSMLDISSEEGYWRSNSDSQLIA